MSDNFSVINNTKSKTPPILFKKIKDKVLGEKYELSLVFIGEKRSKNLNKKHRDKNYPANILSFPLEDNIGEIFINLNTVKKEVEDFQKNGKDFLIKLFIHGLLHLKGFKHSKKMDIKEDTLFKFIKDNF